MTAARAIRSNLRRKTADMDKGVNKHVFVRLSKFSKFAVSAIKSSPSTIHSRCVHCTWFV